ncbi:hypothetical protein GOHSU_29_00560 [Gordonia hirsuta DSM 44140 = NBRC 16056]|uniref:DUF4190 domain-containing protein n=1 Tax=Gordonia hirsuta DSM 44140 = NBRC 16056 TaxID=1121927 RepID=L7LDG4_9ACTN|nr:hypothetical protein [Gordonia hirsuta]GAC58073.1 hypothetical protein GOHSU_29_00560 [Gordonia hirsuta DSM 44140 = NBRC 16056]
MTEPTTGAPIQSTKATLALVLAIVSLVMPYVWFILAIAAIALARVAQTEIMQSGGRVLGAGRARAAAIVGWIGLAGGLFVTIALHTVLQ